MRKLLLYPSLFILMLLSACREEGVNITTITGEVPDPPVVTIAVNPVTQDRGDDTFSDATVTGINPEQVQVNPPS